MEEGVAEGASHEGSGGPLGPTELRNIHDSGERSDEVAAAAAGSIGEVGPRAAKVRAGAKGSRTVGSGLQGQSMGAVLPWIQVRLRSRGRLCLAEVGSTAHGRPTSEGWWYAAPSTQLPCQVEVLPAQDRADVGNLSAQLHASSATPAAGRALAWGATGSPWAGTSSWAGAHTPQHAAMDEVSSGLAQSRTVLPLAD